MDTNKNSAPVNTKILDYNKSIEEDGILEVTSTFITETSTGGFDPAGLFSEQIFGLKTSPERLVKFGYISLRLPVFHPRLFNNLIRLRAFYNQVMAGKQYAIFDENIKDLVPSTITTPSAGTGFHFFLKNFPKIELQKTNSLTRNDCIETINKYRNLLMIDKWLVAPAGIRDIEIDETTNMKQIGDLNTYYVALLNYARAMPDVEIREDLLPMFDTVRYSMQMKIVQIQDYIENICKGKTGYLEKHYGARNIALGSANVISPARMIGKTVDDVQYPKADETLVPIYLAAKSAQPIVIYYLRRLFYQNIINDDSSQISLIDNKYK